VDARRRAAGRIRPRAERASAGVRAGKGCGQCRGTGYRGRKAIAEMMVLNDEMRELIVARAPIRQLKEAARAAAPASCASRARPGARGETTLEEINRVTFVAVGEAPFPETGSWQFHALGHALAPAAMATAG
jgi:general secretion pathway protein E